MGHRCDRHGSPTSTPPGDQDRIIKIVLEANITFSPIKYIQRVGLINSVLRAPVNVGSIGLVGWDS